VNYITGVHDGIILCATISPGWSSGSRACAVRLADGNVLWWDALAPVSLEDGTFLCMDGSVRDLRTARVIRHQPAPKRLAALEASRSLGLAVELSKLLGETPQLAAGIFVAGKTKDGDYSATTRDGRVIWR
jgi:hypothetical protein